MGVDLCQYGNHKIDFSRDLAIVADEIKNKLDTLRLINVDYLKVLMNLWDASTPDAPSVMLVKLKDGIYKELHDEEWNWEYEIRNENGYQFIEFYGFRGFNLEFTKDKIYFWDPHCRFFAWFYTDSITRNEWRKYMYQIITLFGGNRAIYLPDNMLDSDIYLDEHDGIDSPFEEIECELIAKYGKNAFTYKTVKEEDDIYYYIDEFKDLKIENEMTIGEFKDYLWKIEEEELTNRLKGSVK